MKAERVRRVGLETAWVVSGQGAAVLGSLVGVRLLTNVLPPAPYGEMALGLTVAMLAQQTLLSPLSGASLRFWTAATEAGEERSFVLALGRLMSRAGALLAVGVALLASALTASGRGAWTLLAVLALLYALLAGAASALDGVQNASRRRAIVAWHDGVAPWLRFLAAVGFVGAFGASAEAALGGYVVATALVLASQSAFFGVSLRAAAPPRAGAAPAWEKRILGYAWPFVTWGLFSGVQLSADRWSLGLFATTRDVGLYAVLYQLGYFPMSLASGLLTQVAAPVLFARAGDGTDSERVSGARTLNRRLVFAVGALSLAGTGAAFLLHEVVFRFLADARYGEVSWMLPWMVLSGGLFATGQTAVLSVLAGESTRALIAPKVATAVLGAALAFLGAARSGLPGVVFAGLLTSLVYCAWALLLVRRLRTRSPGD